MLRYHAYNLAMRAQEGGPHDQGMGLTRTPATTATRRKEDPMTKGWG
jgi:hypothetical protein